MTDRFRELMGATPHLTRLSQRRALVSREERHKLDIPEREMALVREIKMAKGQQDWMFARTIVPHQTLNGAAKRIASLQDKPIGKILFGRHGAKRKRLVVRLTHQLPDTVIQMGIKPEWPLWQRESIFEFSSGPLMVTELFLPDCPIYTSDSKLDSSFNNQRRIKR